MTKATKYVLIYGEEDNIITFHNLYDAITQYDSIAQPSIRGEHNYAYWYPLIEDYYHKVTTKKFFNSIQNVEGHLLIDRMADNQRLYKLGIFDNGDFIDNPLFIEKNDFGQDWFELWELTKYITQLKEGSYFPEDFMEIV